MMRRVPIGAITCAAITGEHSRALDEEAQSDGNSPLPPLLPRVRSYDELLDAHSLHQFLIFNARCVEASPEFASFQRTYAEHWPVLRAAIGAW